MGKIGTAEKGGSLRLKVKDQRKGGCAAPFVLWFWPGEGRVRENGEALWAVAALVSLLAEKKWSAAWVGAVRVERPRAGQTWEAVERQGLAEVELEIRGALAPF